MSDAPAGKHWIEYVATGVILVISVLSLWVAIGTEDANRKMVAAASWPFLQIQLNNLDSQEHPRIDFYLVNAGVGPAKIESFQLFWKGKSYSDALEYLHDCCGLDIAAHLREKKLLTGTPIVTGDVAGFVFRAGEARSFLGVPLGADNAPLWRALNDARGQTTFRACYCSVFEECWISDLRGLNPKRVDKCPVVDANFPG